MIIEAPDERARTEGRARQARLTKPTTALGRLEELSAWACAVQRRCPPGSFGSPALAVFAGDHGIARTVGTSAYPPEVTAQMVVNLLRGGAAANVLARQVGARVRVVDVSVDADPSYLDAVDPKVASRRVRRSSGSIDREDALSARECREALSLGRTVADELIDAGADLLLPGDMGIGNTTPAAALIAVVAGADAEAVTGRGSGIDDATRARKLAAIRAAIARAARHDVPEVLLARIGGADLAAMTGYLLQSAARGVPVVLDGIVSLAAALMARSIDPAVAAWWVAGHRSTEPAATLALDDLRLDPLLDLDLRLGEGTGALLALPVLEAAIRTLAQMATFGEAGVTDRAPGA